jgi:alkanesulfonate monooxygenase SsuD/methylene tetrahydromethanopterin reductase-like flavin-dependent oxidoreductase (luciferase family)
VRFGVFLLAARFPGQDHATVLDGAVAAAVAAEEAGVDDVWVAEHHFLSYGTCPSAITLAGYLLGATRRISVGTAVSVLPLVHPVALAEQSLPLDQLSRGRFHLGVGRGGPWVDLTVFTSGTSAHEPALFARALDLLLAAMSEPSVAGSEEPFRFPPVPVVPRPRTLPRPPVLLAATGTTTARLAARRGLPLLLGMHADNAEKVELLGQYRRAAADAGRSARVAHVSAALGYVADSDREALRTMRACLPRWLSPGLAGYRRADGRPHRTRDPLAYTELLCRLHPVGSARRCRERLAASAAATGVEHVILMVEGTGDGTRTRENIARFGAQVLPDLRGLDLTRLSSR